MLQDFPATVLAVDHAGRQHEFSLQPVQKAGNLTWLAQEKNGYSFSVLIKNTTGPNQALARLLRKVTAGLQQKNLLVSSLDEEFQPPSGCHYLEPVGIGRIDYNEASGACRLVLDGQMLAAEDFFTLLSTYSGHNLVYQIQDATADILEKDMALLYCRIDARSIQDHFSKCLSWFLEGSFLSYKREAALASALERPLAEFGLFCRYRTRQEALMLGQLLIRYLGSFKTDAQSFPASQIKAIRAMLPDEKADE